MEQYPHWTIRSMSAATVEFIQFILKNEVVDVPFTAAENYLGTSPS